MSGMMLRRKILPATDIVPPVSNPGSRRIEPGRNLSPQRIPGGIDIRRPEDRAVVLGAGIRIPREDQCPMIHIAPETIVKSRGVKEGIDVVVPGARTDGKVTAIGRQVGFGFIRP